MRIKFQGPNQIHVQDIRGLVNLVKLLQKRGITLVIYDAVSPKVYQHYTYDQGTAYQISSYVHMLNSS